LEDTYVLIIISNVINRRRDIKGEKTENNPNKTPKIREIIQRH